MIYIKINKLIMSTNKTILNFNKDKFNDLRMKIKDLSSIDDVLKLKINKDKIFMYSMVSNESAVLSLKSHILETSDYITNFNSDITYDYVISGSSKFVKNISFFNSPSPINLTLNSKSSNEDDEVMHVRAGLFTNGKLKISCIGSEQFKIKDITIDRLENILDISNSKWSFNISNSDFNDIKKLSSINSEDRIIDVNVIDGVVSISEPMKWELEVDNISERNNKITFVKKYLSNIDDSNEFIKFDIFETFILVKTEFTNLMMSFETNFE